MIDDEESEKDDADYLDAFDSLMNRLRKDSGGRRDEMKGITKPDELVGKQVARVLAERTSAPRVPVVIEFTDGTRVTVYLARETDEDWAEFHLVFHAAWCKSREGYAAKKIWRRLEDLLYYKWGIDTVEYHSPDVMAILLLCKNEKGKANNTTGEAKP